MEKRTNSDFSKHVHRVEIFKSDENEIRIDHFQVEKNNMLYIQFISTDRTLTVTGDYGNWVFCRPFHPSPDGFVSDHYWLEKLRTYSIQSFDEYDFDEIEKEITELIESGLELYGYEGDELIKAKDWFDELLDEIGDHISYEHKAYRDYNKPDFIDYDMIPITKLMPVQLEIIFDAFDEICKRLKDNNQSK
jgi:hypothetical protein